MLDLEGNRAYILPEVAKGLHVSVKMLRQYIRKGNLRASLVGRQYVVTTSDLVSFLKKHRGKLAVNP